MNILIVGAGLSGAVIGRILAEKNHNITIIDKREHFGGNCYDDVLIDENNNLNRVHKYGPHLMHHSDDVVHTFLMKYSEWVPYEHQVKVDVKGKPISFPINAVTLKELFDIEGEENVKKYFDSHRNKDIIPKNCDELFEHSVGNELADIFFRPYTEKMWGVKPSEIDCAVGARIPVRENNDERYFSDKYQYMPKYGYTEFFRNLLDHSNITVKLNTEFNKSMETDYDHVFNSMPIDIYYNYVYGKLPYRSLEFVVKENEEDIDVTTINSSTLDGHTRYTKWKNIPGHGNGNLATYEYPVECTDGKEPYYPVLSGKSLYNKYAEIENEKTTFIGRLGMFQYFDMWKAIKTAIGIAENFKGE